MKFFFFVITLIICQYFINQIAVDARPKAVKKFSWAIPLEDNHQDDFIYQLSKRKRPGWGKRALTIDDYPYVGHENSARIWLDDK